MIRDKSLRVPQNIYPVFEERISKIDDKQICGWKINNDYISLTIDVCDINKINNIDTNDEIANEVILRTDLNRIVTSNKGSKKDNIITAVEMLLQRRITFKACNGYTRIENVFKGSFVFPDRRYITLSINKDALKFILNFEKYGYNTYKYLASKLTSKYSMRFYEMIYNNKENHIIKITPEEIIKMFMLEGKPCFKNPSYIKKTILDRAREELSRKTDVAFSIDVSYTGKRIDTFYIIPKKVVVDRESYNIEQKLIALKEVCGFDIVKTLRRIVFTNEEMANRFTHINTFVKYISFEPEKKINNRVDILLDGVEAGKLSKAEARKSFEMTMKKTIDNGISRESGNPDSAL